MDIAPNILTNNQDYNQGLFGTVMNFIGQALSNTSKEVTQQGQSIKQSSVTIKKIKTVKKEFRLGDSISYDSLQKINQLLTVEVKRINQEALELSPKEAKAVLSKIEAIGLTGEVMEDVLSRIKNPHQDDTKMTLVHFSTLTLVEETINFLDTINCIATRNITDTDVEQYWASELKKPQYSKPIISGKEAIDFLLNT